MSKTLFLFFIIYCIASLLIYPFIIPGVHPPHGEGVRLPVRAGPVQVAPLVAPTDREAEDHLGLQDPLPGRAVPPRRRQDPVRGRRPGTLKRRCANSRRVSRNC